MNLQEKCNNGFTLIELISVIVLLSVMGIVGIARLGNLSGFDSHGFYNEVVNAVRYGQKLAISTGCSLQVTISATGYALHQRQTDCITGAFTRDVVNPSDRSSPYQNSNPDVNINPAATLEFSASSTATVNGLASDQVFTVNGRQFTVYSLTGLVQ